MTNRSYLNFDISIERAGEHYRAHVTESCAGEGSVEFELPFSEFELENFILKMGHARRSTGRTIRGSDSPEMAAAKQFGGKLFGAVFQGDVYACLRASLDEARSQGQGVRVLLRLDPGLADIPWEYIYNPAWNQFFALSADTPLVRYLELTPPVFPLPIKSPLRLLVVLSSPSEYAPLDVELEWHNLQSALEPLVRQGLMEVERLESAALLALQRQLRRSEYHIFHFIGHGDFDESAQDGLLLFTDELGHGKPLSGQYLGTLLRDHHTLRLAVLNACEGARTGRVDPFAGVAHSLVQMGLPAVIAMQFEISDKAAILFAQEFYTALADGYPVDAALADARKALFASNDREWGTPVLFSRVMDGRIFELTQPVAAQVKPEVKEGAVQPVKVTKQKEEAEANRLYEDGLSAFYLEDWGRAEECFQAALKVQPDHPEASEKLVYAQRQLDLAQRYAQAQQQLTAQEWEGALQILEKLETDTPQYRDVKALLQTTRKRARLAELYSDAIRLSQAGQWSAVVNAIDQMRQLDPDCPDPDGLLPAAKKALGEAERQQKLTELYRQALQAMDAQNWREARNWLMQVRAVQENYRDAARLLEKVQAELARQAAMARQPAAPAVRPVAKTGVTPRKKPNWFRLAVGIGGMILLVGIVALGIGIAKWQADVHAAATEKAYEQWMLGATHTAATQTVAQRRSAATETAAALFALGPTSTPIMVADAQGAQMALIPAGRFRMGSEGGESDESPVHTVNLTEAFYMDIYEVTNAAYAACEASGACSAPVVSGSNSLSRYYDDPTYVNYPVINVTWDQANEYCAWRGGSLPTEAQWEYAARGGWESMLFPWGDESPVCTAGVDNGVNYLACESDTVPVGSYAPNGYGLYDMVGNVWEWVADWYQSDYYSIYPQDGWPNDSLGPETGESRVLRGGSFNSLGGIFVADRKSSSPVLGSNNLGFRCVVLQQNFSATPTASMTPTNSGDTATPEPVITEGPPQGQIVFTCQVTHDEDANQICVMNSDGSDYRQLTYNGDNIYASFAPDNQSIVYISNLYSNQDIFEVDLNGNISRLTQGYGPWAAPHISPDGTLILAARQVNQRWELWTMDRNSNNKRVVYTTSTGAGAWDPIWSPDGSKILFASDMDGSVQLYTVNAQGFELTQVTEMVNLRGRSDWSPDNTYIATYAGTDWEREIYLMQLDGANLHAITFGGNNLAPSFSPDGQWIVFMSYRDNFRNEDGCEIYIMTVNGTDVRRLTNNDYCDWQPRWSR